MFCEVTGGPKVFQGCPAPPRSYGSGGIAYGVSIRCGGCGRGDRRCKERCGEVLGEVWKRVLGRGLGKCVGVWGR